MEEGKGRVRRRGEVNSKGDEGVTDGPGTQFGTINGSRGTAGILEINTRGILRKPEGVGGIKRAGTREWVRGERNTPGLNIDVGRCRTICTSTSDHTALSIVK
jgi:hypothetical protein